MSLRRVWMGAPSAASRHSRAASYQVSKVYVAQASGQQLRTATVSPTSLPLGRPCRNLHTPEHSIATLVSADPCQHASHAFPRFAQWAQTKSSHHQSHTFLENSYDQTKQILMPSDARESSASYSPHATPLVYRSLHASGLTVTSK